MITVPKRVGAAENTESPGSHILWQPGDPFFAGTGPQPVPVPPRAARARKAGVSQIKSFNLR